MTGVTHRHQLIMKSLRELGLECLDSMHLMSTNNAALRVAGVNFSFGGLRALNDVYLEIGQNEVVGLIGPNGAGKTTLFNALCGLVKPDSGKFFLDGQEQGFPHTAQLVDLGIARTLQGVGLFHCVALQN